MILPEEACVVLVQRYRGGGPRPPGTTASSTDVRKVSRFPDVSEIPTPQPSWERRDISVIPVGIVRSLKS